MKITIRDTTDRTAALERLRVVERWAIDGAKVGEMVDGCQLLDVCEDGAPVGAIALQITGELATITAAATRGRNTDAEIELLHQALKEQGVCRVRMYTRRPGAIRKTLSHGYRVALCELVKEL